LLTVTNEINDDCNDVFIVKDAENDVLGDASDSAAQPASSTSDAVSTATSSQHQQQQCDDRLAGELLPVIAFRNELYCIKVPTVV